MSTQFQFFAILSLCVLPVGLTGCGGTSEPKIVPVSGVVTLNGVAVEGATVTFLPDDSTHSPATSKTDENGKFQLTTKTFGDGAMIGTHKIKVTQYSTGVGKSPYDEDFASTNVEELPEPVTTNAMPEKYALVTTSGLTFEVVDSEEGNTVQLDLVGEPASASAESPTPAE